MIQESAKSDASRPASAPRPPGIYPRSPRTGPPTKLPIRQVQESLHLVAMGWAWGMIVTVREVTLLRRLLDRALRHPGGSHGASRRSNPGARTPSDLPVPSALGGI
jgi:hypothetical protein